VVTRRQVIWTAIATLVAAPRAAGAQAPARLRRVGVLMATNPAAASHIVAAFTEGLRERGHVEGRDVVVEPRWADGRPERFPALAKELVRLKVDVIVASSTPAAEAAREETRTIPIVMVNAVDPVEARLVASLVEPGGNVTGLSAQLTPAIRAKQLQLLRDAVPRLGRLAILRSADSAEAPVWKEYEAAAQELGLRASFFDVKGREDLEQAFVAMARGRMGAVLVPGHPVFFTERGRIVALAAEHRLPGIFSTREFTDIGGLMSYSARLTDQFRRAADYVDRILKGASPAKLPVEQPTQFELVINLKTARALGLALSEALLVRADELLR
jgi:putative ABC transport system substrate-binding protein